MMLKDPNNPFMRKLTLGGQEGLAELQRENIWKSIIAKKQIHNNDMNEFLNALSDDEFTEFIQARDMPIDKINQTGRESEGFTLSPEKEEKLDLKE